MVLPRRLPCLGLLFAAGSSAFVTSSNTSTTISQFSGTLPLQHAANDATPIAQLVPLTREAAARTIEGNLYNANFSNVAGIADNDIAYISCDSRDYPGLIDAQRVFTDAYENANISGVILYSIVADYCDYEQDTTQETMQSFPVLSMVSKQDAAKVHDALVGLPVSTKYFVHVQGRASSRDNFTSQPAQQNPLGPSPSTAVAMIILYSITGIITALFLVIIITGAIRAHRHPERYGPRNVLGRPRQSRARGLARAMLDTIPIVKFGEKEPSKPADAELASTSETGDVAAVNVQAATQPSKTGALDTSQNPASDEVKTSRDASRTLAEDHQEGIAPAQSVLAATTSSTDRAPNDEHLGCSICTEDFEMGQDLRVLPCDHKFHPECVDPWLLNVSGTCPLCRVDLNPIISNDSSADEANPPREIDPTHRRRSAFRDILSLGQRPNASAEERIVALRRLREQRMNRSAGEVAHSGADADDAAMTTRDRRSRRMSTRISNALHGHSRTTREEDASNEGERGSVPQPRDGEDDADARQ